MVEWNLKPQGASCLFLHQWTRVLPLSIVQTKNCHTSCLSSAQLEQNDVLVTAWQQERKKRSSLFTKSHSSIKVQQFFLFLSRSDLFSFNVNISELCCWVGLPIKIHICHFNRNPYDPVFWSRTKYFIKPFSQGFKLVMQIAELTNRKWVCFVHLYTIVNGNFIACEI